MENWKMRVGDCMELIETISSRTVQCCVTSPPSWGLRDVDLCGQVGMEEVFDDYIEKLVEIFREVRRVLCDDGTLWVNLEDSYAQGHGGSSTEGLGITIRKFNRVSAESKYRPEVDVASWSTRDCTPRNVVPGLKPKDLIGIPWQLAFALRDDGWYLRSEIIWSKVNPKPESVTDRPTQAHAHLFLLSKLPRYYYDADAVRVRAPGGMKNRRSVWRFPTQPFRGAHFAVTPEALVAPCILAGSAEGDLVLDPFAGVGTVGVVAQDLGRRFEGIEIQPEYVRLAEERLSQVVFRNQIYANKSLKERARVFPKRTLRLP